METSQALKDDKIHRELYNRSQDIIAVKNPYDEDYRVIFDMRIWVVPGKNKDMGHGKGVTVLPRHLANKYRREQVNKYLMSKARKLVDEENLRRAEKGMTPLTKYQGENSEEQFESKININGENERLEASKIFWLGLVQRAPDDLVINNTNNQVDTGKTVDERISEELDSMVFTPEASQPQNIPQPAQSVSIPQAQPEDVIITHNL